MPTHYKAALTAPGVLLGAAGVGGMACGPPTLRSVNSPADGAGLSASRLKRGCEPSIA